MRTPTENSLWRMFRSGSDSDLFDELVRIIESGKYYDSYLHPLGFVNIDFDHNRLLRSHIWLPGIKIKKQPEWPIHNHKYKFITRVIRGGYVSETFQPSDIGKSYNIWNVIYDENGSFLSSTGNIVKLVPQGRHKRYQGDLYTDSDFGFHRVRVPYRLFTVSIMKISYVKPMMDPFVLSPVQDDREPIRFSYARVQRSKILEALTNAKLTANCIKT